MITKEQAETYKTKYIEYMDSSIGQKWDERKREAHTYAASFLPEIDMRLEKQKAFLAVRTGREMTDDDRAILHIFQGIGGQLSRMKHAESIKRELQAPAIGMTVDVQTEPNQRGSTAYEQVKAWCEGSSFIPTPSCLEHFGSYDSSSYSRAMSQLRDEGYTFERVARAGYKVVRPVVKAVKPTPPPVVDAPVIALPAAPQPDVNQIAAIVAAVMKAMAQ